MTSPPFRTPKTPKRSSAWPSSLLDLLGHNSLVFPFHPSTHKDSINSAAIIMRSDHIDAGSFFRLSSMRNTNLVFIKMATVAFLTVVAVGNCATTVSTSSLSNCGVNPSGLNYYASSSAMKCIMGQSCQHRYCNCLGTNVTNYTDGTCDSISIAVGTNCSRVSGCIGKLKNCLAVATEYGNCSTAMLDLHLGLVSAQVNNQEWTTTTTYQHCLYHSCHQFNTTAKKLCTASSATLCPTPFTPQFAKAFTLQPVPLGGYNESTVFAMNYTSTNRSLMVFVSEPHISNFGMVASFMNDEWLKMLAVYPEILSVELQPSTRYAHPTTGSSLPPMLVRCTSSTCSIGFSADYITMLLHRKILQLQISMKNSPSEKVMVTLYLVPTGPTISWHDVSPSSVMPWEIPPNTTETFLVSTLQVPALKLVFRNVTQSSVNSSWALVDVVLPLPAPASPIVINSTIVALTRRYLTFNSTLWLEGEVPELLFTEVFSRIRAHCPINGTTCPMQFTMSMTAVSPLASSQPTTITVTIVHCGAAPAGSTIAYDTDLPQPGPVHPRLPRRGAVLMEQWSNVTIVFPLPLLQHVVQSAGRPSYPRSASTSPFEVKCQSKPGSTPYSTTAVRLDACTISCGYYALDSGNFFAGDVQKTRIYLTASDPVAAIARSAQSILDPIEAYVDAHRVQIPPKGCPTATDNATACSAHGECMFATLTCRCYENAVQGYWNGVACDECSPGYYGPKCLSQCPGGWCNPCNGHGTCSQGTNGDGTCSCSSNTAGGFWTRSDCSVCAAGFYGSNCSQSCTS